MSKSNQSARFKDYPKRPTVGSNTENKLTIIFTPHFDCWRNLKYLKLTIKNVVICTVHNSLYSNTLQL